MTRYTLDTNIISDLIRNPQISPGSVTQATEQAGLWILTTGSPPPNPTEVLASQRARDLFDVMGMEFDLLIADSPPIQVFADAPILSSFMDGTLLVVESRRGRRTQLRQAQAALVRAGANVVGVVLNRVSPEANPTYAMYFDPGSDAAGPGQQGDLGSDQVVPVGVSPDRSPGPRRRSGRESTASNPEQG